MTGIVALLLGLMLGSYFFLPAKTIPDAPYSAETVQLIRYFFTASLGIVLIEVPKMGFVDDPERGDKEMLRLSIETVPVWMPGWSMGEGGVSGACPGESSRPGHPKGRKRRSGWDSRTDVKGWTRELAFDQAELWWSSVVSSEPTAPQGLAPERELMVLRVSANWLYRRIREE
ncbi:MAG: hypothetical protein WCQ21_09595 [Verrucomicrobiota bacterium]